jgi:ketol-acid reductoisomerase
MEPPASPNLDIIRRERIVVVGFGSQGSAQAQNLRDSGLDVRIALYEGSPSRARAEAVGFTVMPTEAAAAWASLVMVTLPDGPMPTVYSEQIAPHLAPGSAVAFSHGFNLVYGRITPAEGLDVVVVSPKGAGPGVRAEYEAGRGVPALVGVERDATGQAEARAWGYAWGLGCARAGIFKTTAREETVSDLFGEQAVLCGGVPELLKTAFEVLTARGVPAHAAYFECIHELKIITDLIAQRGLEGMRELISDTAEWGGYQIGPRVVGPEARAAMVRTLDEIEDGSFAERWIAESESGGANLRRLRQEEAGHPAVRAGQDVRRMMSGQ